MSRSRGAIWDAYARESRRSTPERNDVLYKAAIAESVKAAEVEADD